MFQAENFFRRINFREFCEFVRLLDFLEYCENLKKKDNEFILKQAFKVRLKSEFNVCKL